HTRAQKAIEGLRRPMHDGFILIKRGIEEDWDARQRCKRCQELPVARVDLTVYRLQPPRAVYMRHCRDHGTFVRPYRVDLDHERIGHSPNEVIMECLL